MQNYRNRAQRIRKNNSCILAGKVFFLLDKFTKTTTSWSYTQWILICLIKGYIVCFSCQPLLNIVFFVANFLMLFFITVVCYTLKIIVGTHYSKSCRSCNTRRKEHNQIKSCTHGSYDIHKCKCDNFDYGRSWFKPCKRL